MKHRIFYALCFLLVLGVVLATFGACTDTTPPLDTGAADPGTSSTDADGTSPDASGTDPVSGDTAPSPTDTAENPAETGDVHPDTEPETLPDGAITLPEPTVPEPDKTAAEMPRLDITTEGGAGIDSKEMYTRATISLSGCHENYVFSDVAAGVRVRGNSTAVAPKKPYRIKFDAKQSMLGLNGGKAYKSWCLMADYYDGSMLRTWGTFKFAKALMENRYFSSDCTHVEVYINGQYNGVYLLCEQTQINEGRVDIPEMAEGDTAVEQGYLLVGQGGRTDEPGTVVVYPEITVRDRNGDTMYFGGLNFALSGGDYTEEQKAYVSKYVSGVFKVVAHAVYDNEYYVLSRGGMLIPKRSFDWAKTEEEKQIETISAVFNIESAVSMCILDEIVKNLDAMTFNMYVDLSPDGDGVLTLAAPWDFDFSMANTHYSSTHSTSGFYATNLSYSEGMRTNLWYVMLGSIGWFEEMVKEEWQANYIELQTVVSEMVSVNYAYDAAFDRDFERWGLPADRQLIHHHDQGDLRSFDDHVKAGDFVANWLEKRLRWLNRQWGDGTEEPVGPAAAELQLTFGNKADMVLVSAIKRCEVTLTSDKGLCLRPSAEARDPYFSFNYDLLDEIYSADEYAYLEFTYMIPADASADSFVTELFLCSGNVHDPTGGISTTVEVKADGRWHTARVDLGATGYWAGDIHEIRFDFFSSCVASDCMYLKEFKLLNS